MRYIVAVSLTLSLGLCGAALAGGGIPDHECTQYTIECTANNCWSCSPYKCCWVCMPKWNYQCEPGEGMCNPAQTFCPCDEGVQGKCVEGVCIETGPNNCGGFSTCRGGC